MFHYQGYIKNNHFHVDIYKYYNSTDKAKIDQNEKLLDTAKFVLKDSNGNKYLAHTLNNTVVAPPRMLIAFLENNLQADGSVRIPEALRPYMGGKEKLEKK